MAEFPTVSDDDVAFGKVAFCTPAPRQNKRRLGSGEDAAARRPFWAPDRDGSARVDATAAEKRLVCKVYQKLNDWLGRRKGDFPDAPVLPNADWFSSNPNGPIREIAAELLGISSTTVGKYWKEMQCGGGVLVSAKPRGPAKKSAVDMAIKGYRPEGESMYELIKRRMEAVRESGRVNTSRNLPRWATEDEDGPRLPRVSDRFFRKVLSRLGFGYTKRRKLVVAARAKPYVVRRRKAYCLRRTQRVRGEKEFRPRVFLDASFINKNAMGQYTWSPIADAGGNVVEDLNGGGAGERWTILHAMTDWRDEGGGQKTELMPGTLLLARGLSLSHEEFIPWFTALNERASAKFPGEVVEIHLDNARIHLYSEDWNPRESRRKKADLAERAMKIYQPGMGMRRQTFAKYVSGATKPELVRVIEAMEGKRVPEIFKIARQHGNTVERTPPYHPEVQPMEFLWAQLKGGYGQRYESTGVKEYVEAFFDGFCQSELSRVVSHCDRAAECLLGEEPQILLEDDMAPLDEDPDLSDDGADLGDMPDF